MLGGVKVICGSWGVQKRTLNIYFILFMPVFMAMTVMLYFASRMCRESYPRHVKKIDAYAEDLEIIPTRPPIHLLASFLGS